MEELTYNQTGFCWMGESEKISLIRLPAGLQEDLNWELEAERAREALSVGKYLVWEFDFGLAASELSVEDSGAFFSFTLAIDQFIKSLWNEFKEATLAAVLYRGDFSFVERWLWSPDLREDFAQGSLKSDWRLFCTTVFAEYLHRLASYLPDAVLPFCLFEGSQISSQAALAQLCSKERFAHFQIGIQGALPAVQEAALGVVLPVDAHCPKAVLEQLDEILEQLQPGSFRMLSERYLTEQWDGLDRLIVIAEGVSPQGKRMLQGFCAAGGEIIVSGKSLGLAEERSLEEFRRALR